MGWSSDLESGGRGFDSRPPPRSFLGNFFVNFGMSWDVSGSGLGTFSDMFGMVLEKMSDGFEKYKFSKMTGSIFPESGYLKITYSGYPRPKHIESSENDFLLYFCI